MLPGIVACRCPVPDWRALRTALGMTQAQFAELLRVNPRTVLRWEAPADEHRCPNPTTLLVLEVWLDHETLAARLRAAGVRNPFGLPASVG
jgi:hypothetical protein